MAESTRGRPLKRSVLYAIGAVSALATCSPIRTRVVRPEEQRVEVQIAPDGKPQGEYRLYGAGAWPEISGSYDGGGRKTGLWTIWDSKGVTIMQVTYREGLKEGPCRMWYSSYLDAKSEGKQKLQVDFVGDRMHGRKTTWYPNGRPKCDTLFDKGTIVSARCWDPSGIELSEDDASRSARSELKADLEYLQTTDDVVERTIHRSH